MKSARRSRIRGTEDLLADTQREEFAFMISEGEFERLELGQDVIMDQNHEGNFSKKAEFQLQKKK